MEMYVYFRRYVMLMNIELSKTLFCLRENGWKEGEVY